MAIDHRMVHFRTDDLSEVLDEFEQISDRSNGREWITISPWVDAEFLPVRSLLQRIFSARASKIPEVTWVPPTNGEPAQLGLLHATGAGAFGRLEEAGAATPTGWIKVSDHSKRGLLLAIHPDTNHDATLEFAIEAAESLALVPTDDRWIAQVSTVSK